MLFTPFPTLVSKRLNFRALDVQDLEAIFFLRSNPVVNQYIVTPPMQRLEEAAVFIVKIQNDIRAGRLIYWALCLKGKKDLIGTICLWNFSPDKKTAEIGYSLHPGFQGRGYMHEALGAVTAYAFEGLGLEKVEAFTNKHHHRSIHLLEKNGFQLDAHKEDPGFPLNIVYHLDKTHWHGTCI